MSRNRIATVTILIALLVCSACSLQFSGPVQGNAVETAVAQTMSAKTDVANIVAATLGGDSAVATAVAKTLSAQTDVANVVAATLAAMATNTPVFTPTPSATPLPTLTFTPARPMISVSVATNCRTGPGKVYDMVGALPVGQTAEVVGRAADSQYWLIRNPSNPSTVCWLWGYYATVTGNTSGLPVATPPPTPTPSPSFTFSYVFWGLGPGYQCFKFEVKNTGSVTWESFAITLHNGAHGTTATGSSNEFINYDNWCINTGSQSDLMPGETGTASVKTFLAYNPAGETFDVTLKLCSENALGGICVTKTITFTP